MTTGTEKAFNMRSGPAPGGASAAKGPSRWSWFARHPWPLVCVAIVALATAVVLHARTSPGFDPYGWLVWGYQTLRLNLNLGGAPSWKPVTFIFTVPYSIFGHLSYWLWMITSASIALGGPVVAGRIVFRIVRETTDEVWPAIAGAVFAGAAVLGIYGYTHYWLSSQSDPMLLTFFLLAIDMHLCRHPRWALTFLFLCSIGRPETWPFFGLYVIWAWRAIPSMRILIAVEVLLVPLLWFGVPVLSGSPWDVAGQLAEKSPRELHSGKIIGTITRFRQLSNWPVEAAAGLGLIWGLVRRDWRVVGIGACAGLWVVIEIGFSLHGFPGVPRYMFEAAGAMIVVSGIGIGWLLSEPARLAQRFTRGIAGRVLGLAVVLVLVALVIPKYSTQVSLERKDLTHERARTNEIHRLDAAIKALGGYKFIRSCGAPAGDVEWVSILAWYTKLDVGYVGHRPHYIITKEKNPFILFTALYNGWIVHTYHLRPNAPAGCSKLNGSYYIVTPQHPGGFLGHTA